jgi:hypothetical protein
VHADTEEFFFCESLLDIIKAINIMEIEKKVFLPAKTLTGTKSFFIQFAIHRYALSTLFLQLLKKFLSTAIKVINFTRSMSPNHHIFKTFDPQMGAECEGISTIQKFAGSQDDKS